ncbi:MAG: alpha-1,6-mannanase [Bacteroidaceae bacterium]|nr:alpha-1,6-mannanase [Bacteroidaceae bacterium]
MKKILIIFCAMLCVCSLSAQTFTITDSMQWKAYDDFNAALLDKSRNIYKADTEQNAADHRGNGSRDNDMSGCAAAIWCQAIFYDMVINAYNRAKTEGNEVLMKKYKSLHDKMYAGEKSHYVNFDFNNSNTNNGWFVYDDIMWWTCALARAYQTFGKTEYLTYSERSFCRVWYGSATVGDDGSYADPARFSGKYGGGMFWEWQPIAKANPHQPGDFRSACINFPTVIAACLLHQLVPEGRTPQTAARPTRQTKEWYLEKAIEIYDWASKTLAPSNGRVADGIHGGAAEYKDHLYNQATYIGASCLLYKLTGLAKYRTNAIVGTRYVFNSMVNGSKILNYENGYEQGVYAAIFAQYLPMVVYDLGQTTYLTYIQRNMQKAWDNRDPVRGLQAGNFMNKTSDSDVVEAYGGSGMPALMLMFPAHITKDDIVDGVEEVPEAQASINSDVYSVDGKLVMKDASRRQIAQLNDGLYIYQQKKMLVRK